MGDSEIILSGGEYSGPEYEGSIAENFIPRMKTRPDSIAQVDCATGESINFRDFLQKSLEVSEGLIKFGLKQGDVVVFSCSNNIRTHATAMGIIFAGGVLAPIDQTLKTYELQVLFKQFKPKFIFCEQENGNEIKDCLKPININAKVILIDSLVSRGEFYGWNDVRTEVNVDTYVPRKVSDPKKDIAIISCSSGTTGLPKGVALSHYTLLFNIAILESLHMQEVNKPFLLISPLFWVSGSQLLLNSCYFGSTRFVSKTGAAEDILDGIEKSKAHFLLLSPSSLLEIIDSPNFSKHEVKSVKVLFVAGATLSPAITERVQKTWDGVVVINSYGLTEACGSITMGLGSGKEHTIGKIVNEVKLKIVDLDTGKSVGVNTTGEIRVKTKRIMNGYYNNEEATKNAFDENGWLRTGDLAYYNEDEVLFFVGRIKEAIDYQNFKIAPAEIESYILGLPGIRDVCVVPVPHVIDTNHLRALVVKDPKSDITAEKIIEGVKENFTERKHLKEGVQFVDAIPRTVTGKIKRKEAEKLIRK